MLFASKRTNRSQFTALVRRKQPAHSSLFVRHAKRINAHLFSCPLTPPAAMNYNMLERLDNVLASYETCMERLSCLQDENGRLKAKLQLLENHMEGDVITEEEESSDLNDKLEGYEVWAETYAYIDDKDRNLTEESEHLKKCVENIKHDRDLKKREVDLITERLDGFELFVIVFQEFVRFLNMVGLILVWDMMIVCRKQ
jgi:hypothetical protein